MAIWLVGETALFVILGSPAVPSIFDDAWTDIFVLGFILAFAFAFGVWLNWKTK